MSAAGPGADGAVNELRASEPLGLDYLELATRLLHRQRLADPDHPMWEAADLQWWWPRDQHEDPAYARFWLRDDEPVAAVVFTRWSSGHLGAAVLGESAGAPVAEYLADQLPLLARTATELEVAERDGALHDAARRAGMAPTDDVYAKHWMSPAQRRPPRRVLPPGYRITSRAESATGVHPMAARNGPDVERFLHECSLYDPGLDLAVLAPDGSTAGYALFWPDPVTGVGLVEPMRVEDTHAGIGLAGALLDAGLRGLTERGCTRLSVICQPANHVAQRLYTAAGFVEVGRTRAWRYAGPVPSDPSSAADQRR